MTRKKNEHPLIADLYGYEEFEKRTDAIIGLGKEVLPSLVKFGKDVWNSITSFFEPKEETQIIGEVGSPPPSPSPTSNPTSETEQPTFSPIEKPSSRLPPIEEPPLTREALLHHTHLPYKNRREEVKEKETNEKAKSFAFRERPLSPKVYWMDKRDIEFEKVR